MLKIIFVILVFVSSQLVLSKHVYPQREESKIDIKKKFNEIDGDIKRLKIIFKEAGEKERRIYISKDMSDFIILTLEEMRNILRAMIEKEKLDIIMLLKAIDINMVISEMVGDILEGKLKEKREILEEYGERLLGATMSVIEMEYGKGFKRNNIGDVVTRNYRIKKYDTLWDIAIEEYKMQEIKYYTRSIWFLLYLYNIIKGEKYDWKLEENVVVKGIEKIKYRVIIMPGERIQLPEFVR